MKTSGMLDAKRDEEMEMTRVSTAQQEHPSPAFDDHWDERVDLAAAFRSAARLNLHEGGANHFSV